MSFIWYIMDFFSQNLPLPKKGPGSFLCPVFLIVQLQRPAPRGHFSFALKIKGLFSRKLSRYATQLLGHFEIPSKVKEPLFRDSV